MPRLNIPDGFRHSLVGVEGRHNSPKPYCSMMVVWW